MSNKIMLASRKIKKKKRAKGAIRCVFRKPSLVLTGPLSPSIRVKAGGQGVRLESILCGLFNGQRDLINWGAGTHKARRSRWLSQDAASRPLDLVTCRAVTQCPCRHVSPDTATIRGGPGLSRERAGAQQAWAMTASLRCC